MKKQSKQVNISTITLGKPKGVCKTDRRKNEMITLWAIIIPGNYRYKSALLKYFYQGLPSLKNIYTFKVEIKHTLNNKPQIKHSHARRNQATVVRIVYNYNPEINNQQQSTTSAKWIDNMDKMTDRCACSIVLKSITLPLVRLAYVMGKVKKTGHNQCTIKGR